MHLKYTNRRKYPSHIQWHQVSYYSKFISVFEIAQMFTYSPLFINPSLRTKQKRRKNPEKMKNLKSEKKINSPSLRSHWEAIYSSVVFFRYFWMHLKVLHSVVVPFTSVQNILNFTMFWHLKRQSSYVDENSPSTNAPKPITICARIQHHVNTRTHTYTRKSSVRKCP